MSSSISFSWKTGSFARGRAVATRQSTKNVRRSPRAAPIAAASEPKTAADRALEVQLMDNAGSEPSYVSTKSVRMQRSYPLTEVVGMDHIKQALLLGAVDNQLGGIAIAGRRGTAKSIMARGVHSLLPPIEVIKGSICNADPANADEWEDGLAEKLAVLDQMPIQIRDPPFIQIPLGVTEDRLVGTVDIEASMKEGKPISSLGSWPRPTGVSCTLTRSICWMMASPTSFSPFSRTGSTSWSARVFPSRTRAALCSWRPTTRRRARCGSTFLTALP